MPHQPPDREHIQLLIQHLKNSSLREFETTRWGPQMVSRVRYLLVSDRDFIISLLEKELNERQI